MSGLTMLEDPRVLLFQAHAALLKLLVSKIDIKRRKSGSYMPVSNANEGQRTQIARKQCISEAYQRTLFSM